MLKRLSWVALVAGCSFLGGFAGLFLTSHAEKPALAQSTPLAKDNGPVQVTDLLALGDRFEMVARKVSSAVVYVEARKPSEKEGSGGKGRIIEESGSGAIIRWPGRGDYLVLTNNHVVSGTEANRIVVQLSTGRVFRPNQVWTDPESDVAVLSLQTAETLPTITLGDSDRIQVGNWVLAIGSPFGLNQTVTHGIISARERGQISLGNTIRIKDFLQTDAAINPGSSGGPLLNLNGELIGINTAIASQNGSNSGIAFSIPVNLVRKVTEQLLEKGAVSRGYLGIQLSSAFEPADALRLGLDSAYGAMVEVVYPGTPGATAGLRVGDVILEANNQKIRNENQLINMISASSPGSTMTMQVYRDRKKLAVSATVGDWAKGQELIRSK